MSLYDAMFQQYGVKTAQVIALRLTYNFHISASYLSFCRCLHLYLSLCLPLSFSLYLFILTSPFHFVYISLSLFYLFPCNLLPFFAKPSVCILPSTTLPTPTPTPLPLPFPSPIQISIVARSVREKFILLCRPLMEILSLEIYFWFISPQLRKDNPCE